MSSSFPSLNQEPPGGVDLIQILRTLWDGRKWILMGTILAVIIGVVYALLATPVYRAQAVIAPRERDQGGGTSRMLAQFGGAAALVGSQLGVGSNGLIKLETILKSHEVAEAVVREHDLLPQLFHKKWDKAARKWKVKKPRQIPSVRDGVEYLLLNVLSVSANEKKGIVTVGASVHDSVLAKRIVDAYLIELGEKIRRDVTRDADMNRDFLERQLANTHDPVVVEKVQSMIAFEIEKSMLVSYQAFEVFARPVVPIKRAKPKRKIIVGLSLIIGLLVSCVGVFAYGRLMDFKKKTMHPGGANA